MSGEINVLQRTQKIIVEPWSKSLAIINAGPAGPGGSSSSSSLGAWDATIPVTDETFNHGSDPVMDEELAWAAGTSVETVIRGLANSIAFESWIRDIHVDSTQAHGMAAPGPNLVYRNAEGLVVIKKATTVPADGTDPGPGNFWLYSDNGKAIIHDTSGNRIQLTQPLKNEYMRLDADDAGSSNTTKRNLFVPANNLVVGASYEVSGWVKYSAVADATNGGILFSWAGVPANASIEWSAFGLAAGSTAVTGSFQAKCSNGNGSIQLGAAGATTLVAARIDGTIDIGDTAGKPTLQFSANGAPASATIPRARSRLRFTRVS